MSIIPIPRILEALQLPEIHTAIILGSGLGGFEHELDSVRLIPYTEIPGFPDVSVPGHAGHLAYGRLGEVSVLVFSGRFHLYEGHTLEVASLPVQVAIAAGARNLLLTNAAGGIRESFQVGDFMNIVDTLHLMRNVCLPNSTKSRYANPLSLSPIVTQVAARHALRMHEGTYVYTSGPCYETPAEIRMFRHLGADAVGMSTVPELMVAAAHGLPCAGISLITNAASGITDAVLDHADIKEAAEKQSSRFKVFMKDLIQQLATPQTYAGSPSS